MARSQNGYSANDASLMTPYVISSKGRTIPLRKGPAGALLARFLLWFDANVRDIDPGARDEWGYAERPIRGGTELSNHASGTAADVDATKWPLGVAASSYLTKAEIAKVHAELARYQGCIRWGADYEGRTDPMHFEIVKSESECQRVLNVLNAAPLPAPAAPQPSLYAGAGPRFPLRTGGAYHPGGTGAGLRLWQVRMQQRGWSITPSGVHDATSVKVCKAFQRQCGRTVSGAVDQDTWWDAWNAAVTK